MQYIVPKLVFYAVIFLCVPMHADSMYHEEGELALHKHLLIVSLGSDCMISITLRENGLRKAAFPFDWNFSLLLDKVILLLDEDFEHFLSPQHLTLNRDGQGKNNRYVVEFKHDSSFVDSRGVLSFDIWDKYQRRIARFRALRNYPGKVVFIRSTFDYYRFPFYDYGDEKMAKIDRKEAEALKEALKRYFPGLDFTLVTINYGAPAETPIAEVDNIIEYTIPSRHKKKSYSRIFKELLLRFNQ
jgi:Putative papain-like cysteine peptidase (DUF1796).